MKLSFLTSLNTAAKYSARQFIAKLFSFVNLYLTLMAEVLVARYKCFKPCVDISLAAGTAGLPR